MGEKTPHDSLAKDLLCTVLQDYGKARPHFEIKAAKPQYADVWFSPGEEVSSVGPLMELLVRMCAEASIIEPYSETPRPSRVMDCITKSLTLMRARREKVPPRLWILSPGVPRSSLQAWRARSDGGRWVKGFYSLPRPLNAHIIVLSELPPGPETLILRLLGRSPVRDDAVKEASATIPQLVKHPIGEVLARWYRIAFEAPNPTAYQQELIMDPEIIRLADEKFEKAVEEAAEKVAEKAVEKALEKAEREVRVKAERETQRRNVLKVYAARFGEPSAQLREAIERCSHDAQLDSWLTLVATQSKEDVIAQILNA